jgi:hypothetical protein
MAENEVRLNLQSLLYAGHSIAKVGLILREGSFVQIQRSLIATAHRCATDVIAHGSFLQIFLNGLDKGQYADDAETNSGCK